jgi:hypothetical protein
MALSNLQRALYKLYKAKEAENLAWKTLDGFKQSTEAAKNEVYAELKSLGIKSAKTDDGFTAVIANRVNIAIKHEPSVIDWIRNNPDLEADVYIGLKKSAFDPIARTILKSTGEVVPGTEIETVEYLSPRFPKETKNGK